MTDTDTNPAPEAVSDDTESLDALRKLVVDCPELRELEKMLGNFNFFEVLRLEHHEIRHSNILAWLLDPNGNHGLRDLFLRRWLMRVFHENTSGDAMSLDPVDIDSAPMRSVRIQREWMHVDVFIEIQTQSNETWVIAIENKVHSAQHSDQLARYRDRVAAIYPAAKQAFIFLTVEAEDPEDPAYVVATYGQLKQELDRCLEEQRGVLGDEPRMVIEHYISAIERHFMPGSPIEELATKIYGAHRRALDIIFEYRPDTAQLLTAALMDQANANAPSVGLSVLGYKKGIIYLMPLTWNIPDAAKLVWCEINFYYMDRVVFKAYSGPTDNAWRARLFELSTTVPFKNTQKKKSLPEQYFQFYGVTNKGLNLNEMEAGNVDDIAANIWKWCVEQMADSSFSTMVDSVAKLLNEHPSVVSS